MIESDGFDEQWSAAHISGEPVANTSAASAHFDSEAQASEVIALSEPEVRKVIRAAMAACLAVHPQLLLARAARREAQDAVAAAATAMKAIGSPSDGEDATVGAYIASFQELHAALMQARARAVEPQNNLASCEAAWQEARSALTAVVDEHGKREDVVRQDYFLAAKHLVAISSSATSGLLVSPADVLPEGFVLTPDAKALVVALRTKTFALAKVLGAVSVAAVEIADAYKDHSSWTGRVNEPTRPTEEEIQRYLSQAERVHSDRKQIDRRLEKALGVVDANELVVRRRKNGVETEAKFARPGSRRDLIDRLKSSCAEVAEALSAVRMLEHSSLCPETACAIASADHLLGFNSSARSSLGPDRSDELATRLDVLEIPKARTREIRQIAEVRKLMRLVAVAKAKYNEARSALQAAKQQCELGVSWSGVSQSRNWEEALVWHAGKAQQAEEAKQFNTSRSVKIELLQEQVGHLKADVDNNVLSLERYLKVITPALEQPACDEKRIIIEAGWLVAFRQSPS